MAGAWDILARTAYSRYRYDPLVKRVGSYSGRVEVRSSDYVYLGNRCELISPKGQNDALMVENESSGTQYFALSVRMDDGWRGSDWGTILQLHGPAVLGVHPSFHLQAGDHFSVFLHAGDLNGTHIDYTEYTFSNGVLNPGKWVDFIIKLKFSKDYDGSVDVWRRDEGETDFTSVLSLANVPTLQYKVSLGDHYWQMGYYRNNRYWTNVLWLDCFTRGDDYDAVVAKAWGS
jgi:hypothetical protein